MRSESVQAERWPAFERQGSTKVLYPAAWRSGDPQAAAVAALVARQRRVPLPLLLHRQRREAEIAAARMLAMYLVHVVLGRSYSEVGATFGRDRTTVSHACARIEDQRDDPRFDAEVAALEAAITTEEQTHGAG